SRDLQNNPPLNIPKEDLASAHVFAALEPYTVAKGGPLLLRRETFVEGRGNVIIEYPCGDKNAPYVSFVGSHLDVVPANPDEWDFNPYELSVDGDMLRGRGVTDCLGHVALVTELFRALGKNKPALKVNVAAVLIANEENSSEQGIGVDELVRRGMMAHLKSGPVFWVDSADKQPCLGTAGTVAWQHKAKGKLFHSGLKTEMAINPLEMLMEALAVIQKRFYEEFPAHPEEERYRFVTCSSLKPTQWSYPGGGINQIPGEATLCGDIRVTPFYSAEKVAARVKQYVEDINADVTKLPSRGPVSKYALDDGVKGSLEFTVMGEVVSGIACNIDSAGNKVLCEATEEVLGECKPYSLTGSLPLVKELQDAGFDIQICGYGLMKTYHAKNEYGLLSDFESGFKIMVCPLNPKPQTPNPKP
ncbi:hypothetical protein T484DRAFT_1635481, partial [Baffinella frigidus]